MKVWRHELWGDDNGVAGVSSFVAFFPSCNNDVGSYVRLSISDNFKRGCERNVGVANQRLQELQLYVVFFECFFGRDTE